MTICKRCIIFATDNIFNMKKLVFAALFTFLLVPFTKLEAVEKGDFVIQPNLNLGNYGYRGPGGNGFGATLNFDFAVHDYVSVGPYVGFNHVKAKGWDWKYNRIGFGGRAIFHFWQLIDDKVQKDLKSDKIDWYVPFHLGYSLYKGDFVDGGDFTWGLGMGFRYYFNDKIGIGVEFGGMELSPAKLGVAIKL